MDIDKTSKVVFLLLFIFVYCCSHCLRRFVLGHCLAMQYFVSSLVLQTTRLGRAREREREREIERES